MRVAKLPMRALSAGEQAFQQLSRGDLDEPEVRLHARAAVEEHDDGDWLNRALENGERLAVTIVVDFKIFPREIRDEAAVRVGDGRVDGNRPRPGAERLLRVNNQRRSAGQSGGDGTARDTTQVVTARRFHWPIRSR